MVLQTIKQWFWDCYDHVVRLIVANVVAFVLLGGSAFTLLMLAAPLLEASSAPAVLAALLLVVAPVWLAIWFSMFGCFAECVTEEKDPGFRIFFRGLHQRFVRVWKYFQTCMIVIVILLINIWFYSFSGSFPADMKMLGYLLSGACFWLLLFFLLGMVTGVPVAFRGGKTVRDTIRTGLVMVLKHPAYIFSIFIFLIGLWTLGVLLRFVGVMLFGFAGTVMLLNSTYDVLAAQEEEKQNASHEVKVSTTWKEIEEAEKETERRRMNAMRYNRTFKDILRPWED